MGGPSSWDATKLFDATLNLGLVVHPIELADLQIAKRILQQFPTLSTRDCVHLGMAARRGIETVVSFDTDFKLYPDIKLVTPE